MQPIKIILQLFRRIKTKRFSDFIMQIKNIFFDSASGKSQPSSHVHRQLGFLRRRHVRRLRHANLAPDLIRRLVASWTLRLQTCSGDSRWASQWRRQLTSIWHNQFDITNLTSIWPFPKLKVNFTIYLKQRENTQFCWGKNRFTKAGLMFYNFGFNCMTSYE